MDQSISNSNQDKALRIRCGSFDEFVSKVRENSVPRGQALFRGQQALHWKLESKLERWLREFKKVAGQGKLSGLGTADTISQICNQWPEKFRELVTGMPKVPEKVFTNNSDLWAFGRHYGLITPLLDWTESPYIAAFFAFFGRLQEAIPGLGKDVEFREHEKHKTMTILKPDVAIWQLDVNSNLTLPGEFEVFPRTQYGMTKRQKAQDGRFTMLKHDSLTDIEAYLESRGLANLLCCYEVPGSEWREALARLQRMGIRYYTLFPDFEGAAIEANMEHLMRSL